VRGRFITFEGIEGSGKSTQCARLAAALRARGLDPLVTREPGGTPLGRRLREALLAPGEGVRARSPLTEALLMVADRHEHVVQLIEPALAAGRAVLCDRHADSTLAYQGGGSGVDLAALRALNALATCGLVPDLTFLFDLPVDTALARLAARGGGAALDRFESEAVAFHERVRAAYLELAAAEPARFVVLDATGDAAELERAVLARIDTLPAAAAR
jgi:dTMP kinase